MRPSSPSFSPSQTPLTHMHIHKCTYNHVHKTHVRRTYTQGEEQRQLPPSRLARCQLPDKVAWLRARMPRKEEHEGLGAGDVQLLLHEEAVQQQERNERDFKRMMKQEGFTTQYLDAGATASKSL